MTDIDFVNFTGEDVVRHKLVQRIVNAYAEHAQAAAPELRAGTPPAGRVLTHGRARVPGRAARRGAGCARGMRRAGTAT